MLRYRSVYLNLLRASVLLPLAIRNMFALKPTRSANRLAVQTRAQPVKARTVTKCATAGTVAVLLHAARFMTSFATQQTRGARFLVQRWHLLFPLHYFYLLWLDRWRLHSVMYA